MALVRAGASRRAAAAGGRQAGSGRARARQQARAAGIDDVDDLRRRAAGRGDSGVSARRRRARLAAVARHEHAAEDLSVSAVGQADRRHAAADAHAGAERRHGDSDRRHRRRVCRGHPRGAGRPGARRRRSERRARELAETKYSYEAYLERTRQACAALRAVSAARSAVGQGPGVSGPSTRSGARPRHYSYTALRRSGDGAHVRRSPLRRADRRAGRQHPGARAGQLRRRIRRPRRFSTSARAPGRAALLLARGGASVTAVDASSEMLAVARRARRRRGRDVHVSWSAMRTRSTFRIARSTWPSACAC